jgi:hypothetical protein
MFPIIAAGVAWVGASVLLAVGFSRMKRSQRRHESTNQPRMA